MTDTADITDVYGLIPKFARKGNEFCNIRQIVMFVSLKTYKLNEYRRQMF